MSLIKIFVHAVWSTHLRLPFLVPDVRRKVIEHIRENAESKTIKLLCVNGHVDHIHCLLSLSGDMSAAKTIQLLKGESSYWINKNGLTKSKFEWQNEYYIASVGASDIGTVMRYIENQEEHHRKTAFNEEYSELIAEPSCDEE